MSLAQPGLSRLFEPGILRDTLLPNLIFHTGLAIPAYLLARSTNYVELKDHLWSAGQVANAWFSSIGRRVVYGGLTVGAALSTISRPGYLLLGGATLWGLRLWYRVTTRALRRGEDDPRYETIKYEPGGWNKIFLKMFVPEILAQAVITLPFTAPFLTNYPALHCPARWQGTVESVAVGMYGAGFLMEMLADWQLERFSQSKKSGMMKEGVWSIVRHPNYFADFVTILSFPVLLYSADLLNPYFLLSPLTLYYFLRNLGGDKENEQSQEERYALNDPDKLVEFRVYQDEKNAFWPSVKELANKWTWIVAGCGVGAVALEKGVRELLRRI